MPVNPLTYDQLREALEQQLQCSFPTESFAVTVQKRRDVRGTSAKVIYLGGPDPPSEVEVERAVERICQRYGKHLRRDLYQDIPPYPGAQGLDSVGGNGTANVLKNLASSGTAYTPTRPIPWRGDTLRSPSRNPPKVAPGHRGLLTTSVGDFRTEGAPPVQQPISAP